MLKQWLYQGLGWGVGMIAAAAVVFLAVVAGAAIIAIISAFVDDWKSGGDDTENEP